MPNMRIIATNSADISSITADSQASSTLSVANVKNDYKSSFHRTGGVAPKTAVYTLSWASPLAAQTIGGVCLPCTNLSATATIKVELFSDAGLTTAITGGNTGFINACTNSPIANLTTSTIDGNLFQLGVLSKASVWFPTNIANVRGLKLTISDLSNPTAYLDIARIVCGSYWQPTYNASREGLDLTVTDTSQNSRTDAGDLVSDRGYIYDELSLNLSLLSDTDRNNLLQLTRTAGTNRNILISVFPVDWSSSATKNDLTEQQYTVYGKRANSQFNYIIQGYGSSTMQITGW